MPKIPIIRAKDFYKYLLKYGCKPVSVKSSHFKVNNPKTNAVSTVPIHGGQDIGKGLFAAIIAELGIDIEDFLEFIKNN
jgi:predicted RNA binding protein YcfA (HicA-like mRNA interferase family)